MDVAWAAAGAVAGLGAGAALRGPVFRLSVPSGEADRNTCPHCAAPVGWAAVRCTSCRRFLGVPGSLEVVSAVVLALVFGRFGGQPVTAAFAVFGVLGVALAAIDIAVQRLPDRITLPAFPLLVALLAAAAAWEQQAAPLVRALLGALALAGVYLVIALVRPGDLGGGDVKAAGLAGLVLGWLGWPAVVTGAALGFLLSALVSLVLLAARRITLHSAISFGPFLLGGALIAMLAAR